MNWIDDFQLFLFDFDGLLVNTEHLQFQAYVNTLAKRGCDLQWGFGRFCETAHLNSSALKEAIWAEFPELEAVWPLVYQEKKEAYLSLLQSGKVELMPGVEKLLRALEKKQVRRAVVTLARKEEVALISAQKSVLKTIPYWVTREEYDKPKPDPEGYLKAIQLYGNRGDKIIGFEDSLRGLAALRQTPALPVLICSAHHPLLEMALENKGLHFESFENIPEDKLC